MQCPPGGPVFYNRTGLEYWAFFRVVAPFPRSE
jgi:hypothetical protein